MALSLKARYVAALLAALLIFADIVRIFPSLIDFSKVPEPGELMREGNAFVFPGESPDEILSITRVRISWQNLRYEAHDAANRILWTFRPVSAVAPSESQPYHGQWHGLFLFHFGGRRLYALNASSGSLAWVVHFPSYIRGVQLGEETLQVECERRNYRIGATGSLM